MDIKDFKSGNFIKQVAYSGFQPNPINHTFTWSDPKLNILLEKATLKLGELNTYSQLIPDVNIFIKMHIFKEATVSSQIEGTKTEIGEALLSEKYVDPEKRDDWREVQNYVEAMNVAIEELKNLPLSNRLLKNTHAILLQGVRGKHKRPGEFRASQNWIGGATINDAVFIPPHCNDIPELMSDLEKFLHNQDIQVPHLIKIAIAHYQFETIHPFLDGNGRLGRLMISLYFVSNNILTKPILYLSEFFEKNKSLYYDNLMVARLKSDLSQWVTFFLVAVIETCEKGLSTLNAVMRLKEKCEGEKILSLGKKIPNAKKLLKMLFSSPWVTAASVSLSLEVTQKTANILINDFVKNRILREITGFERNRIFIFDEYLSLFKS